MKLKFPLWILAAGLMACGGEKVPEGLPTVDLTDLSRTTELNLSEVVSDVEYVKLETNDSCLIGARPLFCVTDEYIFALAARDQIFRFSRKDGRFLGEIGSAGQGPEDYSRPTSVLPVDEEARTVAANLANGLVLYSFEGKFLERIIRPEGSQCLEYVKIAPDTYAGYQFNSEEKMLFFDKAGNVKARIPNPTLQPMVAMVVPYSDYFMYDGKVNLVEILDDTIHAIDPEAGLIPRYVLDWGSRKVTLEKMTSPTTSQDLCFSPKALETDETLIIRFNYQGVPRVSFYDKRAGTIRHSAEGSLVNDLDQGAPVTLSSLADGKLVGYVTAEALLDWAEDQPADWADNPRLAAFRSVDEMDNPIVVIGKVK